MLVSNFPAFYEHNLDKPTAELHEQLNRVFFLFFQLSIVYLLFLCLSLTFFSGSHMRTDLQGAWFLVE